MPRCFFLVAALFLFASTLQAQSSVTDAAPAVLPADFGAGLPLSFEPNQGQTDRRVQYLTRGPGYSLYLTGSETVLVLQRLSSPPQAAPVRSQATPGQQVLRFQWQDANLAPRFTGEAPLPGFSNYFSGSNPLNWHTHIPTVGRVRVHGIYPGVDMVYYGNPGQLEYDLHVAPGAVLSRIAWHVSGADKIFLDANGDLVLQTGELEVRNLAPVVYQEEEGRRISRKGKYVIRDGSTVGFKVEGYDPQKPLVIDPILRYSTYLGGSSGGTDPFFSAFTAGHAIAVDSFGFAYITGGTTTVDFPTTSGAFQTTCPVAPRYVLFVPPRSSPSSTVAARSLCIPPT